MNKDHVAEFFRDDEFGVSDEETRERTVNYWSDVYGFSMNVMKQMVIRDAQILKINAEDVCTDMFKFKLIDCLTVGTSDIAKFETPFALHVEKDIVYLHVFDKVYKYKIE